jgi:hypothetical protein
MSDALVRWGWPNIVVVVALAVMPVVSAATMGRGDVQASLMASAPATFAGEIDVAGAEGPSD